MSDLDSHKDLAWLEDYEFLVRNGASKEEAARRLGVSKSTLERRLQRLKKEKR